MKVESIKCDGCGKIFNLNDGSFDVFKFQGNVMHKGGGGLISGNIFSGEICKAESKRYIQIAKSTDETLRIYELDYCKECIKRILEI